MREARSLIAVLCIHRWVVDMFCRDQPEQHRRGDSDDDYC